MRGFRTSLIWLAFLFVINIDHANAGGARGAASQPPAAGIHNEIISEEEFIEWCVGIPGCAPTHNWHDEKIVCGGPEASPNKCDGKYHLNTVHLYEPCSKIETVSFTIPYQETDGTPCCIYLYWRDINNC